MNLLVKQLSPGQPGPRVCAPPLLKRSLVTRHVTNSQCSIYTAPLIRNYKCFTFTTV